MIGQGTADGFKCSESMGISFCKYQISRLWLAYIFNYQMVLQSTVFEYKIAQVLGML